MTLSTNDDSLASQDLFEPSNDIAKLVSSLIDCITAGLAKVEVTDFCLGELPADWGALASHYGPPHLIHFYANGDATLAQICDKRDVDLSRCVAELKEVGKNHENVVISISVTDEPHFSRIRVALQKVALYFHFQEVPVERCVLRMASYRQAHLLEMLWENFTRLLELNVGTPIDDTNVDVLDHATTGPEGKDNCAKFVEILGLRTLFPLFMRTPAKVKRKDTTPDEHEEHVCAILCALLRSCGEDSRQRIMQKFVEHEHEKVDRAVELFLKYKEKVDRWVARQQRDQANSDVEVDADREYLDKLDSGLYTLQNVALILSDVCQHSSARQRVLKLFSMKMKSDRLSVSKVLIPLVAEYQSNLGEEAEEEKKRCDLLIARLSTAEKEK